MKLKKLLALFLAVCMVSGSVVFAAPSVVTTADTATEYYADETETDLAEESSSASIEAADYESLAAAVNAANSGDTILLAEGTYTWDFTLAKSLNFKSVEDADKANVIIDFETKYHCNGAYDVSFEKVTLDMVSWGANHYHALANANSETYTDCIILGEYWVWGKEVNFNNCTFTQTSSGAYNLWTYAAKVVNLNSCTLNSAGKSVLVYNEWGPATELNVTDTTFNASSTVLGKAAIEIDTSAPNAPGAMDGTVISIDAETTATGFATDTKSGSSLWNDKKVDTEDTNGGGTASKVIVAGEIVKAPALVPDMTGDVVDVTAANAQDVLDGKYGSINGKTINFTESIGVVLDLARPTKYQGSETTYYNYVNYALENTETEWSENISDVMNSHSHYYRTLENVTFTADDGVTVAGFTFSAGHVASSGYDYVRDVELTSGVTYYKHSSMNGIKFDSLTITGNFSAALYQDGCTVSDVTFDDCTFTGTTDDGSTAAIKFLADNQYFTNVTVTDCTIEGYKQGVYIAGVDGATISNNIISDTVHNAIALQSTAVNPVKGDVAVEENYITTVTNRAIRFNAIGDADVVIKNNIMVNCGDEDGELIAAVSVDEAATVDLNANYWGVEDVATAVANFTAPTVVGITGGTWDFDVSEYLAEGYELEEDGSIVRKFYIYDWEDLKELDAIVEGGDTLEDAVVLLMNDIDLYELGEDDEPVTFNPIGANKAYFKGTFDGQGHTIKNMYQSGWALGYDWYNYGTIGLFAYIWNATIKNLTIENAECLVEGGSVAAIAGCGWGNCTFENITVKNSKFATYNNRAAGIVGYTGGSGATMKFINVTVDEDTVIAGLWGSFDSTLGGVVGSAANNTNYYFEDVTVACRLDAYNDVTAAYKYYNYRMCGMLIGRLPVFQEGTNEVDPRGNVTLNNVDVTIGEWANYTYIWLPDGSCKRVEEGYAYGGVDVTQYPDAEVITLAHTAIIGGNQYGYNGSSAAELEALEGFDTSTLEVEDKALEARAEAAVVVDEEETYYETLQAAVTATNGSGVVEVKSNTSGTVTVPASVTGISLLAEETQGVVINFNNFEHEGVIIVPEGATAYIKNGSIVNQPGDTYSAIENVDGTTYVEDVVIKSERHGVRVDGGTTTLTDVTVELIPHNNRTQHAVNVSDGGMVIINSGTYTGPAGTVSNSGSALCVQAGSSAKIYGGTFTGGKLGTLGINDTATVVIYGGTFDQDPSAYVADTYKAFERDSMYVVEYGTAALIGTTPYETLEEAFAAAVDSDVIVLQKDIILGTSVITVAKDLTVTLDLNGKTITGVDETTKNYGLIQNNGNLTIKDSVGTGRIEATATTDCGTSKYSAVVSNNPGATLVVDGGTLEHLGGTYMAYGIDSLTNGGIGAVEVTINGGTIKSSYRGIRQFLNSDSTMNTLTINGGTVEGANRAVFFHDPSKKANLGTLTVGENATVNGDIYLFVTSGSEEWPVEVSIAKSAVNGEVTAVNIPLGYQLELNEGVYGVIEISPDVFTVTATASMTEVRYNNGNPNTFTVSYVVTGGDVTGAAAKFAYDNTLFECTDEDVRDVNGVITFDTYDLTTDANGETLIKTLTFKVKENVAENKEYTFVASNVEVVSNELGADSGAQEGFIENLVGVTVTVVAQYDVTLDADGDLAGNTYVDCGKDYEATINDFDENMSYTITYTVGGEETTVEVTKANVVTLEDGTKGFVIEDVSGDVVFTDVTSQLNCEIVLVEDFVTGATLVIVKDGVAAGYTYNGKNMYNVERYVGLENVDVSNFALGDINGATSAFAIVVKDAVTEDIVRAAVSATDVALDSIKADYNVNGVGTGISFSDAMTAYYCYNVKYDFTDEFMQTYLRADVNTDFVVDTDDYSAVMEQYWAQ